MDDFIVGSSSSLHKSTAALPFSFRLGFLPSPQRNIVRVSSNGAEKNNFRQIQTRRAFSRRHLPARFTFPAKTSPGEGEEHEEIEFIITERTLRVQNLLARSYARDLSCVTCSRGIILAVEKECC